jgi:heme-degrading monooxygenase HmoA
VQEGHRADVEAILAPFRQVLASQPGFQSALVAFDAAATQVVSATVWATHADAEAITRTVRDGVRRELGELLRGEPTTEIFEVSAPEPAPASAAIDLDEPLA